MIETAVCFGGSLVPTITLSNTRLDVLQQGRGTPALLLHGLASTKRIWDFVTPLLTDRMTVVAPDQRGHGQSAKPGTGYGFDRVCDDLSELLAVLGLEQMVLAGHSWGADVALHFAATRPERVQSLCLVDGGLIDFGRHLSWPQAEQLLAPPDNDGVAAADLEAAFPRWLGPAWRPEAAAVLWSLFEARGDGTYAPRLSRNQHMEIVRALWEQRPSNLYERLRCPTTILLAVPPEPHDPYTARLLDYRREGLERARQAVPNLEAVVLADTVHDIPLQRPEVVARHILALSEV